MRLVSQFTDCDTRLLIKSRVVIFQILFANCAADFVSHDQHLDERLVLKGDHNLWAGLCMHGSWPVMDVVNCLAR